MNGFLRKITSLAASCLLFGALAISAAVAAADSGSGSTGQRQSSSDNSGGTPSQSDENESDKEKADEKTSGEEKTKDNTGDRGHSENHRRDGRGVLPNPGKAKQGKRFNLHPAKDKDQGKGKGTVKVKLPGDSKPVSLNQGASVPVGSVVDATHGQVTVNTVPREDGQKQWATFSGATFQVLQAKTGKPVTEIRLRGGSFASCRRPAARPSLFGRSGVFAAATRKRKVRSLWGRGKGHFRTIGRNGAATVRGTIWLTQDRCDGTLVRVRRGLVGVRDFKKHKTVAVPAGHSYLARR
jgi:hypothetical protein